MAQNQMTRAQGERMYTAAKELMFKAGQCGYPGPGGTNGMMNAPCPSDPNYGQCGPSCRVIPAIVNSAGTVAAGATVEIDVSDIQYPMCFQKLIIPSSIAPFFQIDDFVIGRCSLNANEGFILGDVFSEVSCCNLINFPCVSCCTDLTVTVTNIDTDPHTFSGIFLGTASIMCG